MANFNQNITTTGLTTTSFVVPLAGIYPLQGKMSIPTIVNGGGSSSVVVTISQTPLGGSPTVVYTGPAGAEGFGPIVLNCAASDSISIAMTSGNADDAGLNVIKSVVAFG